MPTVKPSYTFSVQDFGDVDPDQLLDAADEVADYVKTEILQYVADGYSPVDGSRFRELSEEYADREHGGDTTPSLELTGNMLDGLSVSANASGEVEVFVRGGFENDKASGHNQFPGGEHPHLPVRRFIPFAGESQSFNEDIKEGIRQIVERYKPTEGEGDDEVESEFEDFTAEQEAEARALLKSFEVFFGNE